jgi:hypothetical protein|tara:strand:+ start:530 stop:748 length:219 start_codon:yes stop_codon:yes gene_type:complete
MSNSVHRSQWRLPQELFDKLEIAAHKNNRSINAELVDRLEGSFQTQDESELSKTNHLMLLALCEKLDVKLKS